MSLSPDKKTGGQGGGVNIFTGSEQFGDKVIIETCLRWFRHVQRTEWTYGTKDAKGISQRRFRILEMEADDPGSSQNSRHETRKHDDSSLNFDLATQSV